MSRTKNSIKNYIMSSLGAFLTVVFNFISRTVLIKTLGNDYIGINGLFTNVLSMLSLAELGVCTAIIYSLYKPLQENNREKIKALMMFFKRVYLVIGFVIFIAGVCLIPFLPDIIKDYDRLKNLRINVALLFLLFLFRTTSSYWFFAYKATLIRADQREYVLKPYEFMIQFSATLVQMVVLILFRSYIAFICVGISMTLAQNLIYAAKTNKLYPYIKEKPLEKLDNSESKEIFKNCYALFIYKINSVVTNAAGNIITSAFLGIASVGIYSNYFLIISGVRTIAAKLYEAISASLGNLHACGDIEREEMVFKSVNFLTFVVYGIMAVGFSVICNDFIIAWIGEKFIVGSTKLFNTGISISFAVLVGIEVYLFGMNLFLSNFRNAMGLFQQGKYRPVFTIVINVGITLALINVIGIPAIVIATIISSLATFIWYDPLVIYKNSFKKSTIGFWLKNLQYVIAVLIAGVISDLLCKLIPGKGMLFVLIYGVICVIVSVAVFCIMFFKTEEFRYLLNSAKNLFKRK